MLLRDTPRTQTLRHRPTGTGLAETSRAPHARVIIGDGCRHWLPLAGEKLRLAKLRLAKLRLAKQWAHLGSNQEQPGYEPGALTD